MSASFDLDWGGPATLNRNTRIHRFLIFSSQLGGGQGVSSQLRMQIMHWGERWPERGMQESHVLPEC